jgi:hypothetical protein
MAVQYTQNLFLRKRPLQQRIEKLALLRASNVDFIPLDGMGRTIRTSPLIEDSSITWRERFVEAAIIYITNPLCFVAQSVINDELADCRFIVEEKQGYKWVEHTDNPLAYWLPYPNQTMDIKEFIRAYSTHWHTFGTVNAFMFQQGSILPNGKINDTKNCLDLIFPGRIAEDTESNSNQVEWLYMPLNYDGYLRLDSASLMIDVVYNPVAHSVGIALPTNPLDKIFRIHRLYMQQIEKFFTQGAMPSHILTRLIDIQKEASALSIDDAEIEQAIDRLYARVGRGGTRENGWLGLRGDWKVNKVGTDLDVLVNKDLLHLCDTAVGAVYKIPSSMFWAGIENGSQRANLQQDSINFYNMKIKPFRERITDHMSKFLVPLFIKGKTARQYRISADVSESALAQYSNTKQFRMYERWWQLRVINRGTFLEWVNEPEIARELEDDQYNEYYSGSNNSQGMTVATGDQPVEGGPGGGGGGGTAVEN